VKRRNPLSSFRAQMIAFFAATLLITAVALSLVNQRLEGRTTRQVDEYIQAITLANDLIYQSFAQGLYLYDLINSPDRPGLTVNNDSIIRHILVIDEQGIVIDSTDRSELNRQLPAEISNLPTLRRGDIKFENDGASADRDRTMTTQIDTEKGRRRIIVVISMDRLQRVKDEVARLRLATLISIGLALIVLIAWYSRRVTRPVTNLADAALRVARGDLDFAVKIERPDEVGALAGTFNEMLVDLRRKRELEEQLRRAEQSAVVGRLASGIAHEIRNPLNFINLSIDHLRAKFAPSGEEAHILGMIKDEIGRLNRLVSDFLSYGRPARLKLRRLDVRALVGEIADLLAAQASEQGVRIKIQVESDRETTVEADAEQLKTCLSNLMINAIQAMPEGGGLTVTLRPTDEQMIIECADTGVGITGEALGQIFEPYYSTKETGIGLGLPLTKKIIEEHGGQIEATSEPGVGTKFTVTLPRQPAPEMAEMTNQRSAR
jgi:signal transduction histidine kinase